MIGKEFIPAVASLHKLRVQCLSKHSTWYTYALTVSKHKEARVNDLPALDELMSVSTRPTSVSRKHALR
jgi:hypothetical protein